MVAAGAAAGWFSIVAAAGSCAVMLGVSGRYPLELALPAMVGVHAVIGVGEAAITAAALALVVSARPDLVCARGVRARSGAGGFAAAGLAVAVVLGVLVSPFASSEPDGLEKVTAGWQQAQVWKHSPIPDYEVGHVGSDFARVGVAGLVGTVLAFGIGFAVAGIFRGRKR
jgi:cobalt/nickel transport system permease protein